MESAEREYLAMAYARTSGSAPWTAKTSVWLRAPAGRVGSGRKVSLDMFVCSRPEYVIEGSCEEAAGSSSPCLVCSSGVPGHAGVPGQNVPKSAAAARRTLGDDPALERSSFCPLADPSGK